MIGNAEPDDEPLPCGRAVDEGWYCRACLLRVQTIRVFAYLVLLTAIVVAGYLLGR
jgi:hypothetical protein